MPKPEPTFAHSHQHPHPRANPRPHPHPRPHTTAHLRSALGHAHTHAYTHTDAHNNMPANRAQMHHQYPGLPLPWRPLRTPCVGVPCNSGDFWCVLFVVFCRVVFRPAGDPSFICAKGVYAPNFSMATTSHHTCVSILQNPMNRATCLPAVGDLQCIHNVSRYLNAHSIALCRSKSLLPACSPVFRGTAPDVFQEAVAQATERSHPSTTQRLPTIFTMFPRCKPPPPPKKNNVFHSPWILLIRKTGLRCGCTAATEPAAGGIPEGGNRRHSYGPAPPCPSSAVCWSLKFGTVESGGATFGFAMELALECCAVAGRRVAEGPRPRMCIPEAATTVICGIIVELDSSEP